MSTNPSHSLPLHRAAGASGRPRPEARSAPVPASPAAKAALRQRNGRRMIVAGFVIAVVGVVLYCVASFAGDLSAELGDVVFRNAVPYARATLAVIALGTAVWLVGSVTYLNGVMDDAGDGDGGGGVV